MTMSRTLKSWHDFSVRDIVNESLGIVIMLTAYSDHLLCYYDTVFEMSAWRSREFAGCEQAVAVIQNARKSRMKL